MSRATSGHDRPLPKSVPLWQYAAMLAQIPGAIEAEIDMLIRAIAADETRRRIIRDIEREKITPVEGEKLLRDLGLPGLSAFALGDGP